MAAPTAKTTVANTAYEPTDDESRILEILEDEYQVNPKRIRDETGLRKQRVNEALHSLTSAGWVEKISRGLYRLRYNGECYVEQVVKCRDEDG